MGGAWCTSAWLLPTFFLLTLAFSGSMVEAQCKPALSYENGTWTTPYGVLDFMTLGKGALAVVFAASLNDTFPIIVQPGRSTGDFYKAVFCSPGDVAKCINYGTADPNMPPLVKEASGAWWLRGLKFDAELIASNKGDWDGNLRKLRIENWRPRQWGYEGTSSTIEDCWPNFSGASLMSFFSAFEATLDVYVDEAVNFGQIVMVFRVLGVQIPVPVFLANFTMERMPEQRWYRRSSVIGFPVQDYILHEVVTADGGKGRWYDELVKERNGAKFAYLEKSG